MTINSNLTIDVSIIILSKNGEEFIDDVLSSIYGQEFEGNFEVIVIDSGSKDNTLNIVMKYPVVLHQINPSEFGHGKTRNLGASLARGKYLLYIPQDAVPIGKTWLSSMASVFDSPHVAGGFSRQVPRNSASSMERYFLLSTYHTTREVRKFSGKDNEVSLKKCFYSTVSGIVRASLMKKFPFREDIIMSEDQAWSKDVMLAGYSIVYEPKACVYHSHRYSVIEIFKRNFDSGYSITQIFQRNTGFNLISSIIGFLNEFLFVLRERRLVDIFLMPFYEVARYSGFWLGMHAEVLPQKLRISFSNLRYFWQ